MKKSGIIISNDAEAVNFREIRMGNIAPNTLYRSSHPIKDDKQYTLQCQSPQIDVWYSD